MLTEWSTESALWSWLRLSEEEPPLRSTQLSHLRPSCHSWRLRTNLSCFKAVKFHLAETPHSASARLPLTMRTCDMIRRTMFETIHHFQQLSSCAGSSSCGVYFNTAPSDTAGLFFGATHLQANTDANLGVAKGFLADSNSTVSYDMATSNQGMFTSGSAINNYWSDTTAMVSVCGAYVRLCELDRVTFSQSHLWHVCCLAYQQRHLLVLLCLRTARFVTCDHLLHTGQPPFR